MHRAPKHQEQSSQKNVCWANNDDVFSMNCFAIYFCTSWMKFLFQECVPLLFYNLLFFSTDYLVTVSEATLKWAWFLWDKDSCWKVLDVLDCSNSELFSWNQCLSWDPVWKSRASRVNHTSEAFQGLTSKVLNSSLVWKCLTIWFSGFVDVWVAKTEILSPSVTVGTALPLPGRAELGFSCHLSYSNTPLSICLLWSTFYP